MKMPQPFTHFPSFICMWGAISHNAVRAQPPFSCCILKIVKSCRSKSKFRRRVQMQLIAQNRKYFDVLLQILVIDSKLKGTYTLLMGLFPSCTDFWKIVYYWLFSRLYPCARTRDCAVCTNSEPVEFYEFRVRDSSEFVTLGKFSKILRLFLNILVKVSRKQFFKKSVLADKRHWNQGGPPKFWIENQITYQNKKKLSVLSEL